jgi:hypothetical protein
VKPPYRIDFVVNAPMEAAFAADLPAIERQGLPLVSLRQAKPVRMIVA